MKEGHPPGEGRVKAHLKSVSIKKIRIKYPTPKARAMRIAVPEGAEILQPCEGTLFTAADGIFEVPEHFWYFIVRK